jgi:hypothetical protein
MVRKKPPGIVSALLVLLLALAPAAVVAQDPTWGTTSPVPQASRIFKYIGCAAAVYLGIQSGGVALILAGAVCMSAYSEESH